MSAILLAALLSPAFASEPVAEEAEESAEEVRDEPTGETGEEAPGEVGEPAGSVFVRVQRSKATLFSQARSTTSAAAELVSVSLADEAPRFAVNAGTTTYSARIASDDDELDTHLIQVAGASVLTFGGETVDLPLISVLTTKFYTDGDLRYGEVTVYSSDGEPTATLVAETEAADPLASAGILRLGDPDSLQGVAVASMYGDIIIGGMCLDCFDD